MSREMTMPIEADKQSQEQGGARQYSSTFSMLPKGDGEIATNKLFINLFRPCNFTKFPFMPADLWTYYLRIPIHYLREESDDSDYPKLTLVLCREKFGDYLESVIKIPNPFKAEANAAGNPNMAKCPCCENEQRWWSKFNTRRDELGIGRKQSKGMSKEAYKAIADKDDTLQSYKSEAYNWGANWRHIFSLMDMAKYLGEKPMDEGEEEVNQQLYFAPKTIWDALFDKLQAGYKFYDLVNPRMVLIKRDNTKSAFRCAYSVEIAAESIEFAADDITYLEDESTVPDPSADVEFMSYEEMAVRFDISEAQGTAAPAAKVSAPPPAATPETPPAATPETPPAATPETPSAATPEAPVKPKGRGRRKSAATAGTTPAESPPAESPPARPADANAPAEPAAQGKPKGRGRQLRTW